MDPQWIEAVKQLGVPAVALVLLIWKGWPFLVKQIEDAKAERKAYMEAAKAERLEEVGKHMDMLRARDVMIAEISERSMKAMDALTAAMHGLRDEVRNHNKAK